MVSTIVTIALVVLTLPLLWIAGIRIVNDHRASARHGRQVAATRRTETIDGREFTVTTDTHSVVREKTTGRIGYVIQGSMERDIDIDSPQLAFRPRWIQIQFLLKMTGKGSGDPQWRQSSKFEVVGSVDVDSFHRRTGWLSSERGMRIWQVKYHSDSSRLTNPK